MRTSKITFIFFLFFGFNLYASDKIQVEEVITHKKFKFLFVENHDLPKVLLNITFKEAGYAYEQPKQAGLVWFTSFVIQEGAGKNDSKAFAKKLEDKGTRLNFNAGLESFTVSLDTLSENLEEGLSLLSDAIIAPSVDTKGMNRTLAMAKVQFNSNAKNPSCTAKQALDKLLFKNHPYAKSPYGTLDSLTNITRNDIVTYIKRNFTRDTIIISVVGAVKKEEVAKLLDKYLFKLPPKRSKISEIPVKNAFGPSANKHIYMDISQSVIFFAQKGIVYDDPNYYNAFVLINALGGMIGYSYAYSALMQKLRYSLGIVYGIDLKIVSYKHGSVIAGKLNSDHSTASKAISAIKEVLNKVKKEGIDEQLFRAAKARVINNYIFSIFDNKNIVAKLDEIQAKDQGVAHINNFTNYINNVTLKEVNALAQSLLDPENLFFVEVGRKSP